MATFIVRHKVKNYATWKKAFAEHGKVRAQYGFTKSRVYRYLDDPNHVIVVSEVNDIGRAKVLTASSDLARKMKEAGVVDEPKMFYLDDGESFPN